VQGPVRQAKTERGGTMPIEILMPALSPTMEEGKLARWLVKEGDAVSPGMVVAEIETDKATMEVEAIEEGIVGRLLVAEGSEAVKVNTPIALLLGEGEDAGVLEGPAAAAPLAGQGASQAGRTQAAVAEPLTGSESYQQTLPAQQRAAQSEAVSTPPAANHPAPPQAPPSQPAPAHVAPPPSSRPHDGTSGERVFASPLARRIAAGNGLDLSAINGSGPHGRVVKADVEAALAGAADAREPGPRSTALAAAAASPGQAVQVGAAPPSRQVASISGLPDEQVLALYDKETYEVVPHDGMRRVIAQRLTQSKQTIPHFYMTVECVLDELLRARARMNEAAPKEGPRAYKLSVNDFLIKALALALREVPAANATWTEAGMLLHRHSDVGVAVAVEGGLFTPVIRHAELKTLGEISNEMKDLAGRARNRRLAPHEYQGGTTSISNLGMYGIKSFDAVINPPHATILAAGAGEERAIVVNGAVQVATIMSCTLSCDHRVVDGAVGAEMLNAFKRFVEDPVRMLV
jgi:pyruvate dehydrogenase E2 component (dihydrolipoamide acetyltransferase)